MCADALEDEPECLPLLLIRARAQIALRRDLDAQADLRDVIRLDPTCALAYRLLGVLASRRDEHESAIVFFRDALRLDPGDREAHDWLMIANDARRAAAGAARLPATVDMPERSSARSRESSGLSRLARGTQPPQQQSDPEDRPTQPFARGSARRGDAWQTPLGRPVVRSMSRAEPTEAVSRPTLPTLPGRPEPVPPAKPAPRLVPRTTAQPAAARPAAAPMSSARPPSARPLSSRPPSSPPSPKPRGPLPELPGFGEYLVTAGILTRERLRAAQAYQRSMRVQLATAIVTLGLATPQRIEWAAVAHQSQLARERRP